jgi:RNA polymerase sigma factor (sigma-70 family)
MSERFTGDEFMKTHILPEVESTVFDSLVIGLPGKMHAFTDDELVEVAQRGGSAAAGELLSRHQTFLYKSVLRLAESKEEAEDAVQDALLRAYVNIGKFRRDCKFSSWLIAIGINSVLSAKRKSRRATWVYLDDAEEQFSSKTRAALQDHQPSPEFNVHTGNGSMRSSAQCSAFRESTGSSSMYKAAMKAPLRAVQVGWGLAWRRSRAG